MLPYALMTTFRAEYEGLALWVAGEDNKWKQHVHNKSLDKGGAIVFGTPFGAHPSTAIYASEAAAKQAACIEATRRKHPDGETDCEAVGIVWKQVPNVE
jgi:hypothetical protein